MKSTCTKNKVLKTYTNRRSKHGNSLHPGHGKGEGESEWSQVETTGQLHAENPNLTANQATPPAP